MCFPLFVGVQCLSLFVMHYFVSILFCNHHEEEKKLDALLLLSYRCIVTILPYGAVGWSAVCYSDIDIS